MNSYNRITKVIIWYHFVFTVEYNPTPQRTLSKRWYEFQNLTQAKYASQ